MKVTFRNGHVEDIDANIFRNAGMARFKNFYCSSPRQSLNINADGNLFAGICCSKKYGNIFKESGLAGDLNRRLYCQRDYCTALPDIQADKRALFPWSRIKAVSGESPGQLSVNWDISRFCNYDCWYCLPEFHDKSAKFHSLEKLIQGWRRFQDFIHQFFQPGTLSLYILGGEPTLQPDYLKLIQSLKIDCTSITTLTNGSRPVELYLDLLESSNITISVHFHTAKWVSMFEKIGKLHERQMALNFKNVLQVKLMVQPGEMEHCIQAYKQIRTLVQGGPSRVELLLLRDPATNHLTPVHYSDQELSILSDFQNEVGHYGAQEKPL